MKDIKKNIAKWLNEPVRVFENSDAQSPRSTLILAFAALMLMNVIFLYYIFR